MENCLKTGTLRRGGVTKLLRANLLRLRQSKLFLGTLAFMAGYALWNIWDRTRLGSTTIDGILFDYCLAAGIVSALFSGLFLGTEYAEGTIRNKLVVGHTRFSVYLANLLTNMAVATAQALAYLAVTLGLGSLLLGPPTLPWSRRILLFFLGTLVTLAAFCAIYTAVGMLCARKAVAAVVCLVGAFALFGVMSGVDDQLNVSKYTIVGEQGEAFLVENPDHGYVSEALRPVYQFLDDALPFGQALQYTRNRQGVDPAVRELLSAKDFEVYASHVRPELDPLPLLLYALAVTAGTTAAGIVLFHRKDLK